MKKPSVLIVDDTPKNIQLAAAVLKHEGYSLFFATRGEEALEVLNKETIDLVLMDVMMPDMDGFETTRQLKQNVELATIPIIFLTAKSDKQSIQTGFDIGGVDYITKPFHDVELIARVRTHMKIRQMSQDLKLAADKLYHLANTDALTGIANRLKFNTIAEHQVEMAKRYHDPFSIIFFDIDHFKQINDAFGHAFGDEVLKVLSDSVEKDIRKSDLLARWGGEEFIIIMPQTKKDHAQQLAEKLRETIEQKPMGAHAITCSFGISEWCEGEELDAVLQRADEALYRAKAEGRNRVIVD